MKAWDGIEMNMRLQIIKAILPTGQYMTDKLVNVGVNRWALKPEFPAMIPLPWKLLLEVVGAKRQEPILSAELHLVKRIKPGIWASLKSNFFGADSKKLEKPSW